jgi:NAD(P)H-hydrate epimerase
VVARLAQADGIAVTLLALESEKPLPEEASAARDAWLSAGGTIHAADIPWPQDISLIIDGLLGTGLHSAPRENIATLIQRANAHPAPVLALDIPSGLNAQTGSTPAR